MVYVESAKLVHGLRYTKGLRNIYEGNHILKKEVGLLICQLSLPISHNNNPHLPLSHSLYIHNQNFLKHFIFFP